MAGTATASVTKRKMKLMRRRPNRSESQPPSTTNIACTISTAAVMPAITPACAGMRCAKASGRYTKPVKNAMLAPLTSATMRSISPQCRRTAFHADAASSTLSARLKATDSCMFMRINAPSAAITTPAANGMRHPQDSRSFSSSPYCSSAATALPAAMPTSEPTVTRLVKNPRRGKGAHSAV